MPGGYCLSFNHHVQCIYYLSKYLFNFCEAIFNVADELLKTATQNPRLALHKSKAGWILLGALMTLGE